MGIVPCRPDAPSALPPLRLPWTEHDILGCSRSSFMHSSSHLTLGNSPPRPTAAHSRPQQSAEAKPVICRANRSVFLPVGVLGWDCHADAMRALVAGSMPFDSAAECLR